MSNNLILTGFSGSGKSQVGLAIAGIQGWDFWDTDEEVVRVSGRSIADIFEEDGEAVFRYLEKEAVARACAESGVVVSTGGGAIVDPDNYSAMAASGVIVCWRPRRRPSSKGWANPKMAMRRWRSGLCWPGRTPFSE